MPDASDPPSSDDAEEAGSLPEAAGEVEPEAVPSDDPETPVDPAGRGEADTGAAAGGPGPEALAPALTRDDLQPSRLPDRLGPMILGAVALLMAGFIIGRVTSDDQPDEPPTTTVAAFSFPAGDQDRSGYWGFGGVTPAQADAFDRADDPRSLGTTDTGEEWLVSDGTWGIQANQAFAAGGARPSYAVVDGGPVDRLTEATLMIIEPGAGIVFRYRDPQNHWSLTAAPSRGVWELNRVLDGERTLMAEAVGPTSSGTTVSVAQRGAELQLLIDGTEASRITDRALRDATGNGLVSGARSQGLARWDRFYVGAMP